MSQTMIRVSKKTNFVVIDKTGINDERLSWKAKGLLCYLLSLPDDWKIFLKELCKHASDGRDSTASAIKELIKFGYITREYGRNEKGQMNGYIYTVHETPIAETHENTGFHPETENPFLDDETPKKPFTENTFTDNADSDKPTLLNNKDTKKESIPNNKDNQSMQLQEKRKKKADDRLIDKSLENKKTFEEVVEELKNKHKLSDNELKELLKRAKAAKGNISSYLIKVVENYVKNEREHLREVFDGESKSLKPNYKNYEQHTYDEDYHNNFFLNDREDHKKNE